MSVTQFVKLLKQTPHKADFDECIDMIDENYHFSPTAFSNGTLLNDPGQNNGSCKIFAFGLLNQLNEAEVLACFGNYYREDVLHHPEADNHQNIRQFMLHGWSGIKFSGKALRPRNDADFL